MTIDAFIENYGLAIGAVLYVLIKDIIPFILNKFIPAKMKAAEKQRLDRVSELMSERDWQHKLETDRLAILTEISRATQNLSISMAQTNANITTILTGQDRMLTKQDAHNTSMMEAVADMRESVAAKAPRARVKKVNVQ